MAIFSDDAGNRFLMANTVAEDSWLREEPDYEWFLRGIEYAGSQTMAIPALAACSPEDLYHAVCAILRGAGLPQPAEIARSCERQVAALRSAPTGEPEGERTITVPTFQPGDRVMVDCGQYRGPGVVERDGGKDGEVFAFKGGKLHVNVRPWIGSWEKGYAHSNAWTYPADKVRVVRRGEGGGE